MGIKYLDIRNFREFYSDLRQKLSITSKKEQEIYEFLEDVYNHYEDDKIATHKCFTKIEESTSFSFTEKLYAMILLSMLNLKTQQKRKEVASQKRSFKNTFNDDEEPEEEDDE